MADCQISFGTHRETILVVDDNPDNLGILKNLLTAHGYNVRPAPGGTHALNFACATPPDLVLLDIRMPKMDGFEVCQKLKADTRTQHIPVIFISALDDLADKTKGFSLGAVDYITKPFQEKEVLARVENHLNLYRMQQSLRETNARLNQEIIERKNAEEASEKAKRDWERTFDAVPDLIAIIDTRFRILRMNLAMANAVGMRPDQGVGLFCYQVVHGKDQPPSCCPYMRTLQNKQTQTEEFFEQNLDSHLQVNVSPLFNESSDLIGCVHVVRNINERKQFEFKLEKTAEEANAANQAKSAFLANMSHEIRTPMNAIIGFADLLDDGIRNEQEKQYLSIIRSSGRSLLILINDILDLSKIEAGKLELSYETVDPIHIFKEIQAMFAQKIQEKNLNFSLEIGTNIPRYVMLDPIRLRQILLNLIGNAVKFTDSGTIRLTSQVKEHDNDSDTIDFIISVEDTGIGIAEEEKETIFEAFRQESRVDHAVYGGTGLGLSITKRFVELMGGNIAVSGKKGEGAKFTVSLYNIRKVQSLYVSQGKDNSVTDPDYIFKKAVILITDDIPFNRLLLKSYLKDNDFEFIEAENGKQAVDLAKKHHPDLILMDIKMPVMNGQEATKILKNSADTKEIPIIAITASAMKDTEQEIHDLCDGYLTKPVIKTDLIAELARFIKYSKNPLFHSDAEIRSDFNVSKKEDNQAMIIESSENLLELIDTLDKSLIPRWKQLKELLIIDDVEKFAADLIHTAKCYRLQFLETYSANLAYFSDSFDIVSIKRQLEMFPDIVEQIKKFYNGI